MDSTSSLATPSPSKQIKPNILGPLKKSRIPVLIRKKSEIKFDPLFIKTKAEFNSSLHNFSPDRNVRNNQARILRTQSVKTSTHRGCFPKKEVTFQPRKLNCIKARENKLNSLPSHKSNPPIVDWDSRLRNADHKHSSGESKGDRLLTETTLLLGHISDFFSQQRIIRKGEGQSTPAECEDMRQLACFNPFAHDILNECLIRDVYYCNLLKKKNLQSLNEKRRLELIQRVTQWGTQLKVEIEVVFVTVFIIDAFLQVQKVTDECSALLSVAAFLIANKMDNSAEVPSIEKLIRLAKFKYREKEVRWMEAFVLHKLEFDIFPPTSRYFMELCISQLEFPHEKVKSLIIELSTTILLRSITDHHQISIRASLKAKTVLLVATEYIMFYKESALDIKKYLFFEKAVPKCYALYKKLILATEPRSSIYSSASSRQSVANRFKLQNSASAHCLLVR